MGRPRKYFTEEELKQAQRDKAKRWRDKNPDKARNSNKRYYDKHKDDDEFNEKQKKYNAEYYKENKAEIIERVAEYNAKYRLTPKGRALNLLHGSYKKADKKYNRGECTLTADWIVENILNQPCHYCGRTDWTKMGCDRIDNSLPHTPDNVVPCCYHCNCKKHTTSYDEFMKQIGKVT